MNESKYLKDVMEQLSMMFTKSQHPIITKNDMRIKLRNMIEKYNNATGENVEIKPLF